MHRENGWEKRKGKNQTKHRKMLPLENVLSLFTTASVLLQSSP